MILNKNAWNICLLSRIKEYSLKNTCLKNVIRKTVKINGCFFQQVYCKIWVGFSVNTGKRFSYRLHFKANKKEHNFF